jgi:hypothetical protein
MSYCTFKNVLERETAQAISTLTNKLTWHSSLTKLAGSGNTAFLPDTHWLSGVAYHYASLANQENWRFEMYGTSSLQVCKFTPETSHDWHIDTLGFKDSKQLSRKLSIIIDYQLHRDISKGGNIELLLTEQDGDQKITRLDSSAEDQLSVHVFPSYIPFRTSSVLEGTREYLVCWGLGPQFV